MINRLAKAQKSWIAKFILILTALSFMSLFGVSSYLSSAGNNRTVIKVDGLEISQAEFSYLLQKELSSARNIIGEDAELSEDLRTALINNLAKQLVQNAVIDRTVQKNHVSFSPRQIQAMILSQPGLRDASGNFNREMFRRFLSENHISEAEFVADLKRELARQILIALPVQGFNVPQVLQEAEAKVDNKRRTFKYVSIKPSEAKIDRTISEEEIEQYYEDFNANFIEPERRDVSVVYLTLPDIVHQIDISPEEIQAYYNEHQSEFETPETRNVLQMMFEDEKEANKAFFELQNGADFYTVAAQLANQSREDTDLGYVAEDELVDEAAQEVFAQEVGAFTKPMKVGEMWQIMKVADIKSGSKVPYETAAAQITETLKNEKVYDESYELMTSIEDKLGSGASLKDIAAQMNISVAEVKGLADDGSVEFVPQKLAEAVKSPDFIDLVFSYAIGETSQVLETDEGLAVVRIDHVVESHPKNLNEVRGEIKQLWEANEKTAVAQETLNDVMHDLENGDDLSDVARRYGLSVYISQPITRNETFAGVGYADIREMFAEPLNTPRQIQQGDNYTVAVAVKDYKNSAPLSEAEQDMIRRASYQSLGSDLSEAMLSSYANDYKIRVKYKLLGLDDL